MDTTNNKGQILVEVGVVMLLIALVAFAATRELSQSGKTYKKYQLTNEAGYENKYFGSNKK